MNQKLRSAKHLGYFILSLSSFLFLQCSKPLYLDEFSEVQEKDSIAARYLSGGSINFGLPPWGAPAEISEETKLHDGTKALRVY